MSPSEGAEPAGPEGVPGAGVFSDIADRYDRINTILTAGRDKAWRRKAIDYLPAGTVLDLGAGTGAANVSFGSRTVTAVDPSLPMLGYNEAPRRVAAIGERLPFASGSFDGAFSAFVFRNLTSIPDTLAELHRVVRPGGAAVVVDLSRPPGPIRRALHRVGTAVVVPTVGRMAGAPVEYSYLNDTLDKLPPPEEMFRGGPFELEKLWRMGPLGFVYAVLLRRSRADG